MKYHLEDVHMRLDVWRQSSTLLLAISELKRWAIQMLAKISVACEERGETDVFAGLDFWVC